MWEILAKMIKTYLGGGLLSLYKQLDENYFAFFTQYKRDKGILAITNKPSNIPIKADKL